MNTTRSHRNHISKVTSSRIRKLRKARKWTLDDLAKQIGCSLVHLHRIERSKVNPSALLIAKLADTFNVTIDYLMDRPQHPHNDLPKNPVIHEIAHGMQTFSETENMIIYEIYQLVKSKHENSDNETT